MDVFVITLKRRKDKYRAFREKAIQYGYWEHVSVWHGHDGAQYESDAAIIDDITQHGWTIDRDSIEQLRKGVICSNYPEYGVINVRAHFGLRWSYVELLEHIAETGKSAIVLLDDQYLILHLHVYNQILSSLIQSGGSVLALDPVDEKMGWHATDIVRGYNSFTEEAVLWTSEGAKKAINVLKTHLSQCVGDTLREFYPASELFSTPFQTAKHIEDKRDWESDVHIGEV